MKTRIVTIVLVLIALSTSNINAQNLNGAQLINISGKLRMLSQKYTKSFLMDSYGSTNDNVKKEIQFSKLLFKKNLSMIKPSISKEPKTIIVFNEVQKEFDNLSWLMDTYSPSKIIELMNSSTRLLNLSNDLVQYIKKNKTLSDKTDLSETIDLSGRQRMLSQKLCSFYMMQKIKERVSNKVKYTTNVEVILDNMNGDLNQLMTFSGNTIDIEMLLTDILVDLDELTQQRQLIKTGGCSINLVWSKTNLLTRKYDKLTAEYSKL